jgi:hypothetical protein
MATFLKHVGKVGDRKVAIVFRQVPGDEHMALVVYTETLNQNVHDPLMACIESPQGQQAKELADALNRAYTKDGKIILQMLHAEGMLKRIQTEQIVVTPTPNIKSHIRLNELNTILNEMDKGEEAVKRLAEIDASRGLQDPKDVARRMREGVHSPITSTTTATPDITGIIDNSQLAENLRAQAARMSAEAKGLQAEADRLLAEAASMQPLPAEQKTEKSTTVTKKSGRPKKETQMA